MSETMRAALITADGVEVRDVPIPVPGPDQILVKVRAAALNRADLAMAAGHKHGKAGGAGAIAGMEWAGDVVACGQRVQDYQEGCRVMCSGAGAYAEYALADASRINPIPEGMTDYTAAACLPVALQTMHDAIVTNGRLQPGEAIIIQGASSGVGILGLQIAREMGAGLIIGTSTHAGRRARLKEFGATLSIDSSDPAWPEEVLAATSGKGVQLIVDQVSGEQMNRNMKASAVLGRIVNVGRLGGMRGDFNFDLHALKRIQYIGVTFRTRSAAEVTKINEAMRADLWAAVASGRLRIPVDRTFSLQDIQSALDHMAENRHFAKIIVAPAG